MRLLPLSADSTLTGTRITEPLTGAVHELFNLGLFPDARVSDLQRQILAADGNRLEAAPDVPSSALTGLPYRDENRNLLSKTALKRGYKNRYWVNDYGLQAFNTHLLPSEIGVKLRFSYSGRSVQTSDRGPRSDHDTLFNAEQTAHPDRFCPDNCRLYQPCNFFGESYSRETSRKLRGHIVEHHLPWERFWLSEFTISKLDARLSENAVPFFIDCTAGLPKETYKSKIWQIYNLGQLDDKEDIRRIRAIIEAKRKAKFRDDVKAYQQRMAAQHAENAIREREAEELREIEQQEMRLQRLHGQGEGTGGELPSWLQHTP